MGATVNIRLTSNAKEIVFKLEQFPEQMGRPIAAALDTQNAISLGIAERDRLSFPKSGPTTPEGLRHISGNLVRSGRAEPAVASGLTVKSAIGNPVPYAIVHEFGFSGRVQVGAHSRKNSITRPTFDTRGRERKAKKYANGTGLVRAHSRLVNLPARLMYSKSIDANVEGYKEGIKDAIETAWEGKA